jgi:transketolase C-terminal domain/subunit
MNPPALCEMPKVMRWLAPPKSTVLVASGRAVHWALAARDQLASFQIDAGVLQMLRIKPLPEGFDLSFAERIVVIEDHYTRGGLATLLQSAGYAERILAVGWPDHWTGRSGDDADVLKANGLEPGRLAKRILEYLAISGTGRS